MELAKPRIGLYQPYPHTLGGLQAVVLKLAKALPDFGYEPVILSPEEGKFTEIVRAQSLACVVSDPGPEWHVYGRGASSLTYLLSFKRVYRLVRYWLKLSRDLRKNHIELLHCNDYRGVMLAAPAARLAGIPVIWHMHGFIPSPLANCIAGALVLRTVPVSNGMLAYLKIPSWLLGKVEVIHNGLAMEPAPADGGPATNGIPVVLAVGRLHPVKGFETLLHAFKQVLARVPEVECWIVGGAFGDGHYANELRELTRTLDLERHVKFLGYLPNAHDYMRRCSVLAVPSRVETFGMVAVEAMRASKPVVACRTGGLKEVVADGETGMLVEPGDARQMAVALVKILTCRALAEKLGAAGRTRVLEHFTMERMAASFGALYARMLKAPPVRGGVPSTAGSMPRPGLVTKPLARAALAQPESTNP